MAHTWNYDRAADHIDKKIKAVESVEVVDYTRDLSLENIPVNKGYRVDGVHLYADILNLDEMLAVTTTEGETCHRRTLRFLNLHYRAVSRILSKCDMKRVDFHNQRLHGLVTKPYSSEKEAKRIHRAIAAGKLMIDVLNETGDEDEHIPNAKVRIGIDSGEALAVNNGRNGGREPLFLGDPANIAAKYAAAGSASGIFLTNNARKAIGLDEVDKPATTALTKEEIEASQKAAGLETTADDIIKEWREDLKKNPIGAFEFSRHSPPLRTLDIETLTPGNSRRQDAVSLYADLDGFSKYVRDNIADNPEDVIRVLHVIRAELCRVFESEFDGRRVRYVGDCLHGLLCEGTSLTTDNEETVSTGVLCAGALRSSFDLALERLKAKGINADALGLQIGFEFGPMTVTRLGIQGDRVRCSVSRGVRQSEAEQLRCGDNETAIGPTAYDAGTDAVRDLFGKSRKVADLDYNEAVEALSEDDDDTAKSSKAAAFSAAAPAIQRSAFVPVKPHAKDD